MSYDQRADGRRTNGCSVHSRRRHPSSLFFVGFTVGKTDLPYYTFNLIRPPGIEQLQIIVKSWAAVRAVHFPQAWIRLQFPCVACSPTQDKLDEFDEYIPTTFPKYPEAWAGSPGGKAREPADFETNLVER